ncbi:restriction endonuclease subunit S [Peribacillus sp. FSL E2-0159]|uniref:restriction endonuclease subunit S n=1 Tax=Peribacillus sp. FSL E2-0159 TaxID=2975289 RepID=UPI00315ADE63
MKSNYKRIGDYIKQINVRNNELKVDNLLGINIDKFFMPSVANTIGTDMTKYKIVRNGQFACNRMHVGRDKRLPVALSKQAEDIIVSPAYDVFEIIDKEVIDSKYLMMWFSRAEFDRNAWFYTDADVRGGLKWEDFCNMNLPVPSIAKQKEIVKEYNILTDRINLNNRLIQRLEEAARAIYKQWFVDFEFPDEKNGTPYKSRSGEMEFHEETGVETPKGWSHKSIGGYVSLSQGLVINKKTNHLIKDKGIPLLRIKDLINDTQEIFIDESVPKKNIAREDDIIITRTGQVGLVFRNKKGVIHNNCFKVTPDPSLLNKDYLFWFLKKESTHSEMIELASGSAQLDLTHSSFSKLLITIPPLHIQNLFSKVVAPLERHKELIFNQNRKLIEFQFILLSKLATVED